MKTSTFFIKKVLTLGALAGSLLLSGSSPSGRAKAMADCPNNGSPCVNLDCSYWQCCIDQTYAYGSPNRCQAVMSTYNSWLQVCPAVARCNLYLYGCNQ